MRCSGSFLVNHWSVHGRDCVVHAKMCVYMLPLPFHCVRRAAVKAVLLLLPILGLTWLCGVLVPFSTVMAYIFITLSSLQVDTDANTLPQLHTCSRVWSKIFHFSNFLAYALKVIDDIIGVNKNLNI